MRIERTGAVAALTPRVERFLREALRGASLDDLQEPDERRADYSCLGGLLVVELKSFEDDGSARMENLTDELRQRDDWPVFLGSAPIQSYLKRTNDPDGLNRRVLERVGRAAINHLKKANRQLQAHCKTFPRRNVARILILVNEDHEAYDPNTITYVLWHALKRMDGGKPLYEHVDVVVYLTERHAQVVENRIAFPTIIVEGAGADLAPWKSEIAEMISRRWAKWNGIPLYEAEDPASFSTIDHIPEQAPRHERWRTDYRRHPYLQEFSVDRLRDRFDEIMLIFIMTVFKGAPVPIPQEVRMNNLQHMTHIMLEMANRGIPASDFDRDPARLKAAAGRIGVPQSVAAWLDSLSLQD